MQQIEQSRTEKNKKFGLPPNQEHIIEKKEEGARTTEKRERIQGEVTVHMRQTNTDVRWGRVKGNNSSKCAVLPPPPQNKTIRCDIHTTHISDHLSPSSLTVHEQ